MTDFFKDAGLATGFLTFCWAVMSFSMAALGPITDGTPYWEAFSFIVVLLGIIFLMVWLMVVGFIGMIRFIDRRL